MADETALVTEDGTAITTEDGTPIDAVPVMTKLPQQVEITDAGPCRKHVKVTI